MINGSNLPSSRSMDQIFPFRIDDETCFATRASDFSNLKPRLPSTLLPGAGDLLMCPLESMVLLLLRDLLDQRPRSPSGLRAPGKSNLKPRLPSVLLPGVLDLAMRGFLESDDRDPLRDSGLRENQFSNLPFPRSSRISAACPPAAGWSRFILGLWHFGASGLRHFGRFGTSTLRDFRLRPFGNLARFSFQNS
jgi:hypothetical protein